MCYLVQLLNEIKCGKILSGEMEILNRNMLLSVMNMGKADLKM